MDSEWLPVFFNEFVLYNFSQFLSSFPSSFVHLFYQLCTARLHRIFVCFLCLSIFVFPPVVSHIVPLTTGHVDILFLFVLTSSFINGKSQSPPPPPNAALDNSFSGLRCTDSSTHVPELFFEQCVSF